MSGDCGDDGSEIVAVNGSGSAVYDLGVHTDRAAGSAYRLCWGAEANIGALHVAAQHCFPRMPHLACDDYFS